MTKEQLIYLGLTRANGQDVVPDRQRKYHRGDVERHFEMAFSDVVREVYNKGLRYRDYGQLDAMLKPYENVPVEFSSTRGRYYSDLPINVVQLPENSGIRSIIPRCDDEEPYKRIPNGASAVFNKLDVFGTGTNQKFIWEREGNRVYFKNIDSDVTEVLMKLIPAFSSYEDEDEIPMVSGYEGSVYDQAVQRMMNEVPQDLSDNNNPKIV
jgi:hypothetical protein